MRISVGNLSTDTTEDEIRLLFECFGKVLSVQLDRGQNQCQVDMPSKSEAKQAINGLDGQNVKGLDLSVSSAAGRQSTRQWQKPRRRRRRR